MSDPRSDRNRAIIEWLLFAAASVILLTCTDYFPYGDGKIRYEWLMEKFAPAYHEYISPDTVKRSHQLKYPSPMPVMALPLLYLGVAIDNLPATLWRVNTYLLVLGTLFQVWLMRGIFSATIRRRYAILILIGSYCAPNVRLFYGEIFTAMFVGCGILLIVKNRERWGWPLAIIGLMNTPAHAVAYGFVAARRMWENRRLRYVLIVAAAGGMVVLEHWLRRRIVIDQVPDAGFTGYENDHADSPIMPYSGPEFASFRYPFFFGFIGLLMSFGKGIIWYAPGMLLPWWKRLDETTDGLARKVLGYWWLYFAGVLLVYSKWWAWYAGWIYGDRFMMWAALPATLALAIFLERPSKYLLANIGVLAVFLLSLWAAANGVCFDQSDLSYVLGPDANFAREELGWHVPEFSALWRPFVTGVKVIIEPRDWVVLISTGLIGLWLAAPLLLATLRQLLTHTTALLRSLRSQPWRF